MLGDKGAQTRRRRGGGQPLKQVLVMRVRAKPISKGALKKGVLRGLRGEGAARALFVGAERRGARSKGGRAAAQAHKRAHVVERAEVSRVAETLGHRGGEARLAPPLWLAHA